MTAALVASAISASSEGAAGEPRLDWMAMTTGLPVAGQAIAMSLRVPYPPLPVLSPTFHPGNAEQVKLRPLALAVPDTCSVRQRAVLDAAARGGHGPRFPNRRPSGTRGTADIPRGAGGARRGPAG